MAVTNKVPGTDPKMRKTFDPSKFGSTFYTHVSNEWKFCIKNLRSRVPYQVHGRSNLNPETWLDINKKIWENRDSPSFLLHQSNWAVECCSTGTESNWENRSVPRKSKKKLRAKHINLANWWPKREPTKRGGRENTGADVLQGDLPGYEELIHTYLHTW